MKFNKSPKISFINFNDLKAGISQYNYHKKTTVVLTNQSLQTPAKSNFQVF